MREFSTATAKLGCTELLAELERTRATMPVRKPGATYPTAEELVRQDRDMRRLSS
jgi:hypothetical protein